MVKVNFVRNDTETISVDVPVGHTVMEAAKMADIPEIPATCGGCCACATCHIHVDSVWYNKLEIDNDSLEIDLLEYERGYKKGSSRLGCQIFLKDEHNGLTVRLRNNELL